MQTAWTPYLDLDSVLRELLAGVQTTLGANFTGMYLQGSFALGDADQDSDVDFIVVVKQDLSADEVAALQTLHKRIFALESSWAQHLEGSYFPKAILRRQPRGDSRRWEIGGAQGNTPLWWLDNGASSLTLADHCDTLVVRWTLRERGIILAGPDPKTLIDPVPTDALRLEALTAIRGRSQDELANADNPMYNNRWSQSYTVLQFCRVLHDLHIGHPGSKPAGAAWAKAHLDPRWAGLIDRAWAGRPLPELAIHQPADPADLQATLELVRVIRDEAEAFARANGLA